MQTDLSSSQPTPPPAFNLTDNHPEPGKLQVIKRNGTLVAYNDDKISLAITRAFLAVEGGQAADSARIHNTVADLTDQISASLQRRLLTGGTIHIEEIQDQVELALMRAGEHKVARSYVLYRADQSKKRAAREAVQQSMPPLNVTLDDGSSKPLDSAWLMDLIEAACSGLADVSAEQVFKQVFNSLYDGVLEREVHKALVISARTLIESEPNYSQVTSRLLLGQLRREVLDFLTLADPGNHQAMQQHYAEAFQAYIAKGIELELLTPELAQFDLERLSAALDASRDLQFTYLGLQTLYDRYFIHSNDTRIELPQCFFMRVAMGLAINEDHREARAIEFYTLLSSFDYMSSTPTLFNSGTLRPQLSSCYLTTVPDNLHGIYGSIQDNAMLSKFAGGLGNDWTPVRALGAHIKGTNGKSQGVVPFLKVVNDTAVAVNQGGKRKGAVCAYLESWHLDIEEFLELRKNTGDDRRRTHDMNTANWVPDLFIKRVMEDAEWTLFSPSDVPELHDLYGTAFEKRYLEYEAQTRDGSLTLFKRIPAVNLWRKMLSMLFETGHPWIAFKDTCNLRSPQQHVGVVHSSNLCTEITLNTNNDEIAVCNLGSVNLVRHLNADGSLNQAKLESTITTAVRMLDNVIDINYYSVPQAQHSNAQHRPVGMGIMGFHDALYARQTPYASEQAVEFADQSMELVSYYAISASAKLARERGSYQSFDGSLWSQGVLPIDSIERLADARGEQYLKQDRSSCLNWQPLRELVRGGMRNSNVMAIAPTATIANISGVSQSIEPTYQNLYVKSNLSGEFTVVNTWMVAALKEKGLWDNVMVNDLKYYDGSLANIDRIPAAIRERFRSAFEIEPRWLVEAASRRQKWLDQAQSLNIYMSEASGHKMDVTYKMAWLLGLKTTYYLRAKAATQTEKATMHDGKLNNVSSQTSEAAFSKPADVPQACSIDTPDCEACQ